MLSGAFVVVGGISSAQEPARGQSASQHGKSDFKAVGIHMGSFFVYPTAKLDVKYNDNIYAAASGEKSDTIFVVSPSVSFKSDFTRHSLNIDIGAEFGAYVDLDDENYEDFNASVDGRIDLQRDLTASYKLAYENDHEERSSPDDADALKPAKLSTRTLNLGGKYKPNRFSIALNEEITMSDYGDVTTSTGTTVNHDDRDRTQYETSVRFGYDMQPGYEAFLKGTYTNEDYDDATDDSGVDKDSNGIEMNIGARIDLTGLLQGEVSAGYIGRSYDEVSYSDTTGLSLGADLTWNVTKLSTLKANLDRDINETTASSSSGNVETALGLEAEHELLRYLDLGGSFSFSRQDYDGITRVDDTTALGLNATYYLNRNLLTKVSYAFTKRDSDINTNDYTENIMTLSITGQL